MPARRRVLRRVDQQIEQHLPQPDLIAHERIGIDVAPFDRHRLAAGFALPPHAGSHAIDHVRQAEYFARKDHLAAFDLGDVEHVVDDGKQMVGCQIDLVEALFELLVVAEVFSRYLSHADDRVHGRADLMAHVRQEIGFRLVRSFGGHHRVAHGDLQRLFVGYIAKHDEQLQLAFILERSHRVEHPARSAAPRLTESELPLLEAFYCTAAYAVEQVAALFRKRDLVGDAALAHDIGHGIAEYLARFRHDGRYDRVVGRIHVHRHIEALG